MNENIEQKPKDTTALYMLIGYALFIVLGLYHLMFYGDYVECALNFGIALVFDPFDQKVAWNQRHPWQKAWLIVHLGVAAALLGLGVAL
jgi:hypothetical protein